MSPWRRVAESGPFAAGCGGVGERSDGVRHGFPSGPGEGGGIGSGSTGARLPNLVGAVESGAGDDMSGHGVECIGEGEAVGQVELVIQGEQLEDIGMWSVRARGLGSCPAAVAEGALTVLEPGDRAGVGEAVLGNAAQRRVDAERERVGGGFPRGTSGSCTMSTSSAVSAGGAVQERAGEMLAPKSLPRCRSGIGVSWSKAGLVRMKFSGACTSGRAQTSV
jgi:hypothetical protein